MRVVFTALMLTAPFVMAQSAEPIIRDSCVAWIYNTAAPASEVFVIETGGEWEWIVRPSVIHLPRNLPRR